MTVQMDGQNKFILTYTDNGKGISWEEWDKAKSFGNRLIRIQSEQLRGAYNVSAKNGFFYQLEVNA